MVTAYGIYNYSFNDAAPVIRGLVPGPKGRMPIRIHSVIHRRKSERQLASLWANIA